MNSLATATMTDPYDKVSECIQFSIDDTTMPFVLNDIMVIGQQYTFSLWIMSAEDASLSAAGETFATNGSWRKYSTTFAASGTDFLLNFGIIFNYFFCA